LVCKFFVEQFIAFDDIENEKNVNEYDSDRSAEAYETEEQNVEVNVDPQDYFNNSINSSFDNNNLDQFEESCEKDIGNHEKTPEQERISTSSLNSKKEEAEGRVVYYKV
jgi:hypothetical protein